jgi:hypothetical protein
MAAIGLSESGGNSNAINNGSGTHSIEYSVGLWQINMKAHGTRYGTLEQLKDPATNARAALAIYKLQGLRAWGSYTDGRYKKYLASSQSAYSGGASSGGYNPAQDIINTANSFGNDNGLALPVQGSIGTFLLILGAILFIRAMQD